MMLSKWNDRRHVDCQLVITTILTFLPIISFQSILRSWIDQFIPVLVLTSKIIYLSYFVGICTSYTGCILFSFNETFPIKLRVYCSSLCDVIAGSYIRIYFNISYNIYICILDIYFLLIISFNLFLWHFLLDLLEPLIGVWNLTVDGKTYYQAIISKDGKFTVAKCSFTFYVSDSPRNYPTSDGWLMSNDTICKRWNYVRLEDDKLRIEQYGTYCYPQTRPCLNATGTMGKLLYITLRAQTFAHRNFRAKKVSRTETFARINFRAHKLSRSDKIRES